MRIDSNGDILIGSTGNYDSAKVVIAGAKTFASGVPKQGLTLVDTTAQNTGVGGGIVFDGKYTNGGGITAFGSIEGFKANNTGGNYGGQLVFKTRQHGNDNFERMRITDEGFLGIGTTAPGSALSVSHTNNTVGFFENNTSATTAIQDVLLLQSNTSGTAGVGFGLGIAFNGERNDGNVQRYGSIGFETSLNSGTSLNTDFFIKRYLGTEVFRVTHSGRIVRNANALESAHGNFIGEVGSSSKALSFSQTSGGSEVGSVTTGSSSTSYNTSSDYRLKENVVEITDATTRLKQLKPKRFNFIKDADTTVDGFLAHEVSSVVPEAITGTKDALQVWEEADELPEGVSVGDNKLDNNGNTIPDYQGIDQSKLVPLLVKTIQELEARITTLENA